VRARVTLIGIGAAAVALSGACSRENERATTQIRVIDSAYT